MESVEDEEDEEYISRYKVSGPWNRSSFIVGLAGEFH
jgi:hypothetical protein